LTLLHEHITNKRSRNVPIMSLEPVMLLLVELSVEQKKGKLAKDALYQYKNISQNTNIATIEVRALVPVSTGPHIVIEIFRY
jgi:translation initiation factor 3 subunit A